MRLATIAIFLSVLSAPAQAGLYESLVPAACTIADSTHATAPAALAERVEKALETVPPNESGLQELAGRVARDEKRPLPDARRLVARLAGDAAETVDEAGAALSLLRRVWHAGDLGAALDYGVLAARWPQLHSTPSPEQAFASAALAGHPDAFLHLARLRAAADAAGDDPAVDRWTEQARSLLWARVAAGDCRSLLPLAGLDIDPVRGDPDAGRAIELLDLAMRRRVGGAAELLAGLYLRGVAGRSEPQRAVALLSAAADRGEDGAALSLARLLLAGPLTVRDRARAEQLVARLTARDRWMPVAFLLLLAEDAAGRFGSAVQPARATALLAAAEARATGEDALRLADAHLKGWAGQVDTDAAMRILAPLLARGRPGALFRAAELKLTTDGASAEAIDMLRRAARRGFVPAIVRLLGLSVAGSATPDDGKEAQALLLDAARSGSDLAAGLVADMLFRDSVLRPGSDSIAALSEALESAAAAGSIVAAVELSWAIEGKLIQSRGGQERPWQMLRELTRNATSPERMLEIGRALAAGAAATTHPELAFAWFEACAALGEPRCHAELAEFAADHPGMSGADGAAASANLRIAAAAGVARALYDTALAGDRTNEEMMKSAALRRYVPAMLGMMQIARSTAGRRDEVVFWFDQVRQQATANLEDMVALGRAYRSGQALPSDPDLAFQWFLRAARSGSVVAMRETGLLLLRLPDPDSRRQGETWLQRAVSLGDIPAAVELAKAYHNGVFGSVDARRGFRLSLLAAHRGAAEAMQMVVAALETGAGVEPDLAAAETWRLRLAETGDPLAMTEIARRKVASADDAERRTGIDWLRRAAGSGEPQALYWLGRLHHEGGLLPRDLDRAKHYYGAAAAAGNLESVLALTRLKRDARTAARSKETSLQ